MDYNENTYENTSELSIWDINSVINYIKNNIVQILLLILVFVIIYVVDHISNINAAIFGAQQIIPGIDNPTQHPTSQMKMSVKGKKNKSKK